MIRPAVVTDQERIENMTELELIEEIEMFLSLENTGPSRPGGNK